MFSKFFINRPIFATVLALLTQNARRAAEQTKAIPEYLWRNFRRSHRQRCRSLPFIPGQMLKLLLKQWVFLSNSR